MSFPMDELTMLIDKHCNNDGDTLSLIRQRLYDTMKQGTYRLKYDTRECIIGYLDYDLSYDGIVHVRKIIALKPRVITSLIRQLRDELPWKRVFWYRAKSDKWIHRRRVSNVAMV